MKSQVNILFIAFGIVGVSIIFLSSDTGRAGNYSGLTTDSGTCASCHGGGTVNGTGVKLMGAPASYVAGQIYPLTLTISDPDAVSGGFQIVATNGVATTPIGTFTAGTDSKLNNVQRPVQNTPKLFASGSVSWSFKWTAPATGSVVKFHYSAVACNNDGIETVGDAVYSGTTTGTVSAISDVPNKVTKLKIYPNLVRRGDDITIEINDSNIETSFQIVDLNGRALKTIKKAQNTEGVKIRTSDLPTGRYFVWSTVKGVTQVGDFSIF